MKASIITLQSSINYGSALQTYATFMLFQKMSCEVEFVNYIRSNNTIEHYIDRMLDRSIIHSINKVTLGLFNSVLRKWAFHRVTERTKRIVKFVNDNVPLTDIYKSDEELLSSPPNADIYVTGSDQVWNSIWNGGIELPYYLNFAPSGSKKIAYAASFGVDSISETEANVIKPYLQKYSYISMREKQGVEILSRMGIESTLVLDPTLMLNKNEWLSISKPCHHNKPFALMYILNWNSSIYQKAKKYAEEHDLELLYICKSKSIMNHKAGIKPVVPESVEQLLSYFNDAQIVITDSFHATAFSLNFHRPLLVFYPPRFPGRIKSILALVGLVDDNQLYDDNVLLENPDWDAIDVILNRERDHSIKYLQTAIT